LEIIIIPKWIGLKSRFVAIGYIELTRLVLKKPIIAFLEYKIVNIVAATIKTTWEYIIKL